MYGHYGHLGNVTWIIYLYIDFPFLKMLHIKLALTGQAVSEKMFEYYGNLHVHVCCLGVGADVPLVSFSFQNH